MNLTLLRHGQTKWNIENKIQGTQNIHLTEHGIVQIKEIARYFKSNNKNFHRIITSPLLRAKQSAEICSDMLDIPYKVEPNFAERSFGKLEGLTMDNIRKKYRIDCEEIKDSVYHVESIMDVEKRIIKGLRNLYKFNCGKNLLVVTHGSIIKKMSHLSGDSVGIIGNGTFIEIDFKKLNL